MTYDELAGLPLNERIKLVRKRHGPTQKSLADKLGTSPNRVNSWENGRSRPGEDYAKKIAELGGYPVELFMPADDEPSDVRAELAEIKVTLEAMNRRRDSFRSEIARQLKSQTDLLAELGGVQARLDETTKALLAVAEDLHQASDALSQQARKRRPA